MKKTLPAIAVVLFVVLPVFLYVFKDAIAETLTGRIVKQGAPYRIAIDYNTRSLFGDIKRFSDIGIEIREVVIVRNRAGKFNYEPVTEPKRKPAKKKAHRFR